MSVLRCHSCQESFVTPAIQSDRAPACPKCRRPLNLDPAEMPSAAKEAARDPARLFGRFIVVRELGQGAMAIVQQAWDTRLSRWVAIKFLKPGVADAEVLELFRQEASVVASLDHPNIAPVYDVMELDGRFAIVMKYIDGRTLDEIFLRERGRPSPIETAVRYVRDASLGLGFAHGRGYVHRDVKPGNLMVDRESRVYALDFGLAKVLARSDARKDLGLMMGTPAFMSPEQAMGLACFVDARSDVFSLGGDAVDAARRTHSVPGPDRP